MSTLITAAKAGARTRVPRFAEAAVERARLTVVPPRRAIGRTQAARTPFAVLVIAMLVAGVVGLLMFNTNMQQASFKATALQEQVNVAHRQGAVAEHGARRAARPPAARGRGQAPGHGRAGAAGLRPLSTARVLGTPGPATGENAVRINPLPTAGAAPR